MFNREKNCLSGSPVVVSKNNGRATVTKGGVSICSKGNQLKMQLLRGVYLETRKLLELIHEVHGTGVVKEGRVL